MNQNTNVNLIPKFPFSGNLYFSQYDVGRVATINLVEDGTAYTIPSGATVKIQATKPSGLGFSVECTYSGNVVTVVSTETMTDEYGRFPCELRIESGGVLLGTTNFTFNVEKSPHPDGTTDGTAESVVSEITVALQNALTDLQAESAAQQDAIQAKGETTIASIPSDYTELSNEVADLMNRKLKYQNPLNHFPDADISELKTSATEGHAYSPTGTLVSNFYRGVNGVSLPSAGNLGFLIPVDDISDGDYVFSVKRSVSTTGRCTLQYLNQALGGYETVNLDAISGNSPVWETTLDITAKKDQYSGLKYLRVLFGNTGSRASVYYMPMMIPASTKYKAFFINTSSPLSGKKIALDGDSITYGQGFVGGYAKLLGEEFGMTVQNNAVGGGTLATGTTTSGGQNRHWISDGIDALDEDADYVLISGGINDFFVGVPIGTLSANKYNSALDTTTLIGATEKVCRDLVNRFPTKKIGFMLTHSANDWYRKNYQGQASDTANLTVYHDAIITALKKYSIPYCDLFNDGQFSTEITVLKQYTYNNDGIHPTEDGYRFFYCDKISKFLESL